MPHGLNFTDITPPPPPPPASGSKFCPCILPEMERERFYKTQEEACC